MKAEDGERHLWSAKLLLGSPPAAPGRAPTTFNPNFPPHRLWLDGVGGVVSCVTENHGDLRPNVCPMPFRSPSDSIRRIALMGVMLGALCLGLPAVAPAQAGTYHQVQAGESLESIAQRYGVSSAVVARENRLANGAQPVAGSRLYIPGARRPIVSGRVSGSAAPSSASRPTAPRSTAPARSASPPRVLQSPATVNGTPRATATYRPRMVTVQPGDSLWKISNENGVTVNELARANGLSERAQLEVGQVLRIPIRLDSSGHPTNTGEPPPPVETVPGGGLSRPSGLAMATPTAVFPSGGVEPGRVSSRGFQWPVEGRVLKGFEKTSTSKHVGVDIAAPVGTPVRAARDGTVVYAGRTISAYGNMVIINHDDGLATCYAYNSEVLVRVDQRVQRGQVIARSGDDGPDGRPYLHFQIRRRGDAVDPLPFLP